MFRYLKIQTYGLMKNIFELKKLNNNSLIVEHKKL